MGEKNIARQGGVPESSPAYAPSLESLQRLLVMCVVSLPTFAPSPLRDAWGLVENRPALLRVVAPSALLRAAVTPRA